MVGKFFTVKVNNYSMLVTPPFWVHRLGLVFHMYLCHALFLTEASLFVLGTLSSFSGAVNATLENVYESKLCLRDPGSTYSRGGSCQESNSLITQNKCPAYFCSRTM